MLLSNETRTIAARIAASVILATTLEVLRATGVLLPKPDPE
jgi:hypothetical protein